MKIRRMLYLFGCIGLLFMACKKQFEIMPEEAVSDGVQVYQAGWGVHADGKYYSGCITDASFGSGDFGDSSSSLVLTGADVLGNSFRIALINNNAGIRTGNKYSFENGNATIWFQANGALYTTFLNKASLFSFNITRFSNNIIEGEFVASLVDSATNRVVQITGGQVKALIYGGQQCGAVLLPSQQDTAKAVSDASQDAVLSGEYIQNQLLDGSNYLTLMLDVQKTGPYTILSPTINGMQFVASGQFVHTGLTAIRVAAVGTPQVVGTVIMPVSLNGARIATINVPVMAATVATAEYFPVTGNNFLASYSVNGTFLTGEQMTTDNYVQVLVNVTRIGTYTFNTQTINGVRLTASGNFTQTGRQMMRIECVGTPAVEGKTIIPFVMNNIACNFAIVVLPG